MWFGPKRTTDHRVWIGSLRARNQPTRPWSSAMCAYGSQENILKIGLSEMGRKYVIHMISKSAFDLSILWCLTYSVYWHLVSQLSQLPVTTIPYQQDIFYSSKTRTKCSRNNFNLTSQTEFLNDTEYIAPRDAIYTLHYMGLAIQETTCLTNYVMQVSLSDSCLLCVSI